MENENSLGNILSSARNERSLDLKELSQKTKISVKILKSLEADSLEHLPKPIYVKGFIRILSKTFKLDEAILMDKLSVLYNGEPTESSNLEDSTEEYPKESSTTEEESKENILERMETQDKIDAFKKTFVNKKTLVALMSVVLIIIIVKTLSSFISNLKKEQVSIKKTFTTETIEIQEPQENTEDDTSIKKPDESLFDSQALNKLKDEQKEVKPEVKLETKVVEQTPVIKKEVEEKKEEVKKEVISEGKKFPYKKFYPAPRNVFNIVKGSKESQDSSILPTIYKNRVKEDLENVLIYAQEDTWISYSIDQTEIKRYVLSAGKHLLLQGKEILLFLGNFNSTKIFYNNELIAADTTTGVKSLIFPEERSQDLELPLFPSYKGIPYSQNYYKENMNKESN